MRILALEPYYGGSHRQFLDGWSSRSRHEWTVLGLPAYKWKWRMRHAAISFAKEVEALARRGETWDILFCSDMLNLAEFTGLAGAFIGTAPPVVYFHENQLSYPVRYERERDYHFAVTNITTALAARRVWFNSYFHRESFLKDMGAFLKRMPDYRHPELPETIRKKSLVFHPGIDEFPVRDRCGGAKMRILWSSRWEYDKDPETFFTAMRLLKKDGFDFIMNVLGERFKTCPPVFEEAFHEFESCIGRWGYLEDRSEYARALAESDIVVSTALHEFFGIGVVEAVAAGAFPVTPKRLAYPEIIAPPEGWGEEDIFHDGSPRDLARKIRAAAGRLSEATREACKNTMKKYLWESQAAVLDDALERECG